MIFNSFLLKSFLEGRPKYFNSMEQAIEYSVRSGQIRNSESARVSMTGQIRKVQNNDSSKLSVNQSNEEETKYSHNVKTQIIEEEEEEEEDLNENKTKKFCSESDMNSSKEAASRKFQSNDGFKQPEVNIRICAYRDIFIET